MAGHSKWAQIKHKKHTSDVKRGQLFTKLSRLITLAVAEGGGHMDPARNVRLRMAIDRARSYDMPKENIKRAIEKATSTESGKLSAVLYEAYGPGGVSFLIHATTDNTNRTFAQVRFELEKHHAKIASQGSVLYLFTKCAVVMMPTHGKSQEDVFAQAQEWQALDIDVADETTAYVYIPFEQIGTVSGYEVSIIYRPNVMIQVTSKDDAQQVIECIDGLEGLEDVHDVYTNADIP